MRSVPISIRLIGEFTDSYFYKGRLFLWRTDRSLWVLNWENIIYKLTTQFPDDALLVFKWGFLRNNYLSGEQYEDTLANRSLAKELSRLLELVVKAEIVLDLFDSYQECQVSDFPVEHITDVVFHYDGLYVSSTSGVYGSRLHGIGNKPLERLSDAHTVSISAKYRTVNGACCEDGLFCWPTLEREEKEVLFHSPRFTRATSWIGRDFMSLEDYAIHYYLNDWEQTRGEPEPERRGSPRMRADHIQLFGVKEFSSSDLLANGDLQFEPTSLFTSQYQVFMYGFLHQQPMLVRMQRPRGDRRFFDTGLQPLSQQPIDGHVFQCSAVASGDAVLDTESGTLVVPRESEQYILSGSMNVAVRAFPSSKWYRYLVCSVKEDHAEITCLWPIGSWEQDVYRSMSNPTAGLNG